MKKIKHTKWFHFIIRFLRLRFITIKLFELIPLEYKLANGIVYRIKSPESFSIRNEIFKDKVYHLLLSNYSINTFVDLGCNTGYIACLLAEHYGADNIAGLMVDANPEMLDEANWHIQKNKLINCNAIWGIIGPSTSDSSLFYISDFNITSSAKPFNKEYPIPVKLENEIDVPVLKLNELFNDYFPDQKIDFIKIDIEGSEKELLNGDVECLKRVQWIAIEWHKWVIEFTCVKNHLENINFELIEILKEDTICGLALFKNKKIILD